MTQHGNELGVDEVVGLLDPHGALSRHVKGYEFREAQGAMLRCCTEAYNGKQVAIIEAGTGTGKSLAYLLPALLWAVKNKERTVISTNTINLQEQLLHKDIPLLMKAFGFNVKVVLMKGMGNYLCLRRLSDALGESGLIPHGDMEEIKVIAARSGGTDGSKSELPFVPSGRVWERLCAEGDTCQAGQCPKQKECFFLKARRHAEDAHIVVVNHHLLCADLMLRQGDNKKKGDMSGILPPYDRVVIDEAHHLEEVATEYFAQEASRLEMLRLLARLGGSESGGKGDSDRLTALRRSLDTHFGVEKDAALSSLYGKLLNDIPGMKADVYHHIADGFSAVSAFCDVVLPYARKGTQEETKLRLLEPHYSHPEWQEGVVPAIKALVEGTQRYAAAVSNFVDEVAVLPHQKFLNATEALRIDLKAYAERLSSVAATLKDIVFEPPSADFVKWLEMRTWQSNKEVRLASAALDISQLLAETFFAKTATVILCSATLTTQKTFSFFRERLGLKEAFLPERPITENIFPSPFDYPRQVLMLVPNDMPPPTDDGFTDRAVTMIWDVVTASRGGAFVLFTAYGMLKNVHAALQERLENAGYHVMKQGDDHRAVLLQRFRETERAVLFGTDSFWEGVDVVGDALRVVVLVKLPFQVPTEPIIEARAEAIKMKGGDPFWEYAIPRAIVKFKQGFGRLIRSRQDRGCIVCLDSRLKTKGYGRVFLESLPPCGLQFLNGENMGPVVWGFFQRKTLERNGVEPLTSTMPLLRSTN